MGLKSSYNGKSPMTLLLSHLSAGPGVFVHQYLPLPHHGQGPLLVHISWSTDSAVAHWSLLVVRSFCSLRSDFTDDFMDMLLHTQKCIDIYMKQSNRTSRFVVSILMSFHMLLPNSGSWSLALQVWSLALQVWSLALQVWSLALQVWSLALQVWSLALQVWSLALQVWSVALQVWSLALQVVSGLTSVVIGLTSVSSFLVK